MKAVVFTLGCRVNQYESDVIAAGLKGAGYEVSDKLEYADLYILNTCAVTREAERKSRQLITRARRYNPQAKVYVCGCAAEKNRNQFDNLHLDGIYGTGDKFDIFRELDIKENGLYTERKKAYVNVQDGCDNFCTYCVIPYLRGQSRSRKEDDIVRDVLQAEKEGKEVVITGINIAKYGLDTGTNLAALMRRLKCAEVPLSIGSFYVEGINEELLAALKDLYCFSPEFHLSLQSGDDEVLRTMGRKYDTDEYYSKVCEIKKYFPDARLTTDIIVGFPSETDESNENTMKFIEKVGFSDIHIFVFSRREGTKAYDMPPISPEIVEKRRILLTELKKKLNEKGVKND